MISIFTVTKMVFDSYNVSQPFFQVVEVRERSPVPPLDVLRIYVAAEAGCDGVAVLDRMCARVREADRDRFRLADDAEKQG